MASEPEDSPDRLATFGLAAVYVVAFLSWLPLPRRLVVRIARSRHHREATVFVVIAIAAALILDLLGRG